MWAPSTPAWSVDCWEKNFPAWTWCAVAWVRVRVTFCIGHELQKCVTCSGCDGASSPTDQQSVQAEDDKLHAPGRHLSYPEKDNELPYH